MFWFALPAYGWKVTGVSECAFLKCRLFWCGLTILSGPKDVLVIKSEGIVSVRLGPKR